MLHKNATTGKLKIFIPFTINFVARKKCALESYKFLLCFSDSSVGSVATNMPQSPADLHGMWYPTVRRTLVCLSKLYRCIDVSISIMLEISFKPFIILYKTDADFCSI